MMQSFSLSSFLRRITRRYFVSSPIASSNLPIVEPTQTGTVVNVSPGCRFFHQCDSVSDGPLSWM